MCVCVYLLGLSPEVWNVNQREGGQAGDARPHHAHDSAGSCHGKAGHLEGKDNDHETLHGDNWRRGREEGELVREEGDMVKGERVIVMVKGNSVGSVSMEKGCHKEGRRLEV